MSDHDGSHGDQCFGCRIKSVQLAPSATPSRRRDVLRDPSDHLRNSWERGVPLHNGLPVFEAGSTTPIGAKKFAENRHRIEAGLRQLANTPTTHAQEA